MYPRVWLGCSLHAGSLFVGTATVTLSPGKHRLQEAVMRCLTGPSEISRTALIAVIKSHQTAPGREKARAAYRAVAIRLDANRYRPAWPDYTPLYSYAEQLRYVRKGRVL